MATRFYFRAASVAQVSPDFDAAWTNTTSAVRRLLAERVRSTDTIAAGTARTWTAGEVRLDRQYISPPLAAGVVFTGEDVTCYMRPLESNADDNAITQMGVRVVSEDGATVRATLLAVDHYGSSTELATSATNRVFASAEALGDYTTVSGDRLVVEIGFTDSTGTSPSATGSYGSSAAADLAADEVSTTANNPWIQFSGSVGLLVRPGEWTPVGWGS